MKTAALGVVIVLLAACSGPTVREQLEQLPAAAQSCDAEPAARALDRAASTPEQRAFLCRVNQLETALTGRPLSEGNEVDLLRDGPATHQAQLSAISRATHHVHLITYIMTDDKMAQDYLRVLTDRRAHGVEVRLMFDSVGGRTVGETFHQELAKAGVEVRSYGSMNPVDKDEPFRVSRRHHRKLLIVDGRVAFTGGINISDEYRESSSAGSTSKSGGWRDTHIRVEGPAVAEFQRLFFESWAQGAEPIKPSRAYWPTLARRGNTLVRAVTQHGNDVHEQVLNTVAKDQEDKTERPDAIYASYLVAITSARKRIWITQAYFIPNDEFLDALRAAARRGVDVRLLVPHTSDIGLMVHASRYHYAALLEDGARIYEYSGPMLHAKTAVVDGVWSTVGSSNLDFRSFVHNDEANAIVLGESFGMEMERMFFDDLGRAREITREQWARRSWSQRMRQRMAVLLKYWI